MAVLDNTQLAEGRKEVAKRLPVIDFNKSLADSVFQAMEDDLTIYMASLFGTIDTITAPTVLTLEQKDAFVGAYVSLKARKVI